MKIKLKASNTSEERVLDYLQKNASEMLAEKINAGGKTLRGCFKYMAELARKEATGGYACIDDETVFGWAVHYFEEDSISEGDTPAPELVKHQEEPKKAVKEKKNIPEGQTNMFELFDMGVADV